MIQLDQRYHPMAEDAKSYDRATELEGWQAPLSSTSSRPSAQKFFMLLLDLIEENHI